MFSVSLSAFNRAAVLLAAILFMSAVWGLGHIPDANLQMIVFTSLVSALLADIGPFGSRLRQAVILACYSAAAQFIFSVSGKLPFLQVIVFVMFAYFTFLTLPDRRAGCIVLLTGCLGISAPPGFLPAAGRSIDILTAIPVIMVVTALGNAGRQENGETNLAPIPYSPYQAMVFSAKLGIAMSISGILQLTQGIWIMMTLLFINMSKTSDSSGEKLAWQRVFAVPAGILIGGLLLGTFFRIDHRFIWLLPLVAATGFFILYSGNFFLFSIIFMITLTVFSDWQTGAGHRFNFWENFFPRTTATWIGAMIELLSGYPGKYNQGDASR
ncbi:MAG: hypothetical protein J6S43_02390 [Lentisphaeria bacterium]|nr:hypothetical protein [Lentisphaeria bacterium]